MNTGWHRARLMGFALVLSCCTWGVSPGARAAAPDEVPGDDAIRPWQHVLIKSDKPPTRYRRVVEGGATLLAAEADRSASLMMRPVQVDLTRRPVLHWRWKLGALPRDADNTTSAKEDAVARLVFVFDGDRSKLSLKDRAVARMARPVGPGPALRHPHVCGLQLGGSGQPHRQSLHPARADGGGVQGPVRR